MLLEKSDEFTDIGKRVRAFGEKMEVIGHYTEGMKEKIAAGGILFEEPQNILSERRMMQPGFAGVAANGDEVEALTEIVRGRQPGVLAMIGHGADVYIIVGNSG
ncbi:MAG TPA: hypothetical protein VNU20_04320 [Candidatus Sulfotelmatobacter sp.]|nr:hypothetical protein [Candidatus Sulfotelmatobacter sp.]